MTNNTVTYLHVDPAGILEPIEEFERTQRGVVWVGFSIPVYCVETLRATTVTWAIDVTPRRSLKTARQMRAHMLRLTMVRTLSRQGFRRRAQPVDGDHG